MKRLPPNWWLPWLVRSRTQLVEHRGLLNRLNVFPVADADTGSNLVATVGRAADTAGMSDDPQLLLAARAALRAARGNSGTLTSTWLLTLADSLQNQPQPTPADMAGGFQEAATATRSALSHPVEGTILSVMDALAGVEPGDSDFQPYLAELLKAAERAVRASAGADHARAGWVDAGALGLLLMIDQLYSSQLGAPAPSDLSDLLTPPAQQYLETGGLGSAAGQQQEPTHEVMCQIHLPVYEVAQLRSALETVGDSVSVAQIEPGDEALWAIHVHVSHPDSALNLLRQAGIPHRIRVTSLSATDRGKGQTP